VSAPARRGSEATPPEAHGAEVVIDLAAIAANYKALKAAAGSPLAAVVKADGYGLGAPEIVETLQAGGCEDFFVAHLFEALELRPHLAPASRLYVLHGLWPGLESQAADAGVIPVLNSLEQIEAWSLAARRLGRRLPAVLQVDTGMRRLGLSADAVAHLEHTPSALTDLDLRYLMTHLACAETPDAPANLAQMTCFDDAARRLPLMRTSIANSAAAVSDWAPRKDLARAGIGLFGVDPIPGRPQGLLPAVTIRARVIQMRRVEAGDGVGYGHRYIAPTPRTAATLAIGYADGWPRSLDDRGAAYFGDQRLPVMGGVSMDSCVVDVTDVAPGRLRPGDWVDLVGPHQTLEQLAAAARTIPYDILVSLGPRVARRHVATPAVVAPSR
jgi:alanine racemase